MQPPKLRPPISWALLRPGELVELDPGVELDMCGGRLDLMIDAIYLPEPRTEAKRGERFQTGEVPMVDDSYIAWTVRYQEPRRETLSGAMEELRERVREFGSTVTSEAVKTAHRAFRGRWDVRVAILGIWR